MQRKKTRSQILNECAHLKISEIKVLLGYTQPEAKRVHDLAIQQDRKELGEMIINPIHPRLETVLAVAHKSYSLLEKQIKNAAAEQERTAINQ